MLVGYCLGYTFSGRVYYFVKFGKSLERFFVIDMQYLRGFHSIILPIFVISSIKVLLKGYRTFNLIPITKTK